MRSVFGVRRCPNCGALSEELSPELVSAPRAEDCQFETIKRDWYGFYKPFFSYVRCQCGMLYAPRYISEAQLEELYVSMPPNMAEVDPSLVQSTQFGYFRELERHCALKGDFLEVGPDRGIFAQYCASAGRFRRAWMFESNVEAHEEIRKRLSKLDLEISRSLEDLSRVPDDSISVVAMIHVLDHLIDPKDFLRILLPKMKREATLFVVTHNEKSILARTLKGRWPAYCLQHPHLFNPDTIRDTLGRCGLVVTRAVQSTNYFHLSYLARNALQAAGVNVSHVPLPRLELPLKLGNFITFASPSK